MGGSCRAMLYRCMPCCHVRPGCRSVCQLIGMLECRAQEVRAKHEKDSEKEWADQQRLLELPEPPKRPTSAGGSSACV